MSEIALTMSGLRLLHVFGVLRRALLYQIGRVPGVCGAFWPVRVYSTAGGDRGQEWLGLFVL